MKVKTQIEIIGRKV